MTFPEGQALPHLSTAPMPSDHSGLPLFYSKKAVMLADPVASPMVKPIVTGFTVPARFASLASAANTYLPFPFGRISIISFVPLMSPKNVNPPARFFLKEPAGMVMEKVPTFSCTGSVAGAIPSNPLPVPGVKLPNVTKAFSSMSITACGLNVANGSVVATTAIATETEPLPAKKGELLSWVKAPVVLSIVYAETLLLETQSLLLTHSFTT